MTRAPNFPLGKCQSWSGTRCRAPVVMPQHRETCPAHLSRHVDREPMATHGQRHGVRPHSVPQYTAWFALYGPTPFKTCCTVQGTVCESMFFVSSGMLARVLPHDQAEFDGSVTAARISHLDQRRRRRSLSSFAALAGPQHIKAAVWLALSLPPSPSTVGATA